MGEVEQSEVEQSEVELGEYLTLLSRISGIFSPAAPIDRQDLFAGRTDQVSALLDVVMQAGQHAVIYGERGVGKTSLAVVMNEILEKSQRTFFSVRVNCDGTDDYASIWRKIFEQVTYTAVSESVGFSRSQERREQSVWDALPAAEEVTPGLCLALMRTISSDAHPVLFVDEFDRISDPQTKTLFADTIKMLSDQLVRATLVLVGVADNVDELIAEHQSIERALVQIRMPRMSHDELAEIVGRVKKIGMDITPEAEDRIVRLSQGLPHYSHLIGQAAARTAIEESRRLIEITDVNRAISNAIQGAQQSIVNAYHKATSSTRQTLYRQVLLACALTTGDELGYFAAGDVREPLHRIMGRRYEIPAFSRHLHALSEPERGPVLQKIGRTRVFRFRFINPLLQPFVVMKGLADGLFDSATF